MPQQRTEQLIVTPELGGMRLEEFLERHRPEVDRRWWRKAMRDGAITVNQTVSRPQKRLSVGDVVGVVLEGQHRRGEHDVEAATLDVLYEDAAVLIVRKPAGLHTVPDRGGKYQGVHGLMQSLRPDDDLRIVHRLDAPTSGCLALAKGADAARHLDQAFRDGQVHKEYLALAEGRVSRGRFTLANALGPDPRRPGLIRTAKPGSRGSREARTDVVVEEQFRRHVLLRVTPRTGRTHQIRVHLSTAGYRIAGDPDYGSRRPLLLSAIKPDYKIRRGVVERPLLRRMFLHAEVLDIPSPAAEGGWARAHCPLPDELGIVLEKMRRFAPNERPKRCD